jgi:hypothetical protein
LRLILPHVIQVIQDLQVKGEEKIKVTWIVFAVVISILAVMWLW